jgi:hypothetical protein
MFGMPVLILACTFSNGLLSMLLLRFSHSNTLSTFATDMFLRGVSVFQQLKHNLHRLQYDSYVSCTASFANEQ